MSAAEIFISHTTADDAIVEEIREALEGRSPPVWVDSRQLSGGDDPSRKILARIEQACHFMVVLSPKLINSSWVDSEINRAPSDEKRRTDGYEVSPILPGPGYL